MSAAVFALILIGVLLTLFGVVAQGNLDRPIIIGLGLVAIFGAGLLDVLGRRARERGR